jgi:pimeloyl-ACP methyl ester carboxylesterase
MDGIVRLTQSADDYDMRSNLNIVMAKTLIVASEFDTITPLSDQKELHEGIGDSELVILPDCGHASMYEKPALFVSLVLGFANSAFEGLNV